MSEPLNFIETRWTYLSPFSAHEIEIDGVNYKTAEHAYQTLRMNISVQSDIASATSPLEAWRRAQRAKELGMVNESVDKMELMERIFRAKLDQHSDVREILLETGDAQLQKVFDSDYFWGTGADGSGENHMGKLWMKLRQELRIKK